MTNNYHLNIYKKKLINALHIKILINKLNPFKCSYLALIYNIQIICLKKAIIFLIGISVSSEIGFIFINSCMCKRVHFYF